MGHYIIPRGSQNFLQMRYYLQYRTQLTMPYMIHAGVVVISDFIFQ
jgi:hypothetical protein